MHSHNCFSTITEFYTALALTTRKTFDAQRSEVMVSCSWHSVVLSFSSPFRNGCIDIKFEWSFRDTFPHQLGSNSLQCWGKGLQKAGYICLESVSAIWYCVVHSQDPWIQEWRCGSLSGTTHCYPQWYTSKNLNPVLITLCSTDLVWSLSLEGERFVPDDINHLEAMTSH